MAALAATLSAVSLVGCTSASKPPIAAPSPSALLQVPGCPASSAALPLAFVVRYAPTQSGIVQPAVLCGDQLRFGTADERLSSVSALAKTNRGLVATDSRRGQRDHLVLIGSDGQRAPLDMAGPGTAFDPVADRDGTLLYTAYEGSTADWFVRRLSTSGTPQTIWHGHVGAVFTVGVSKAGVLAVPIWPDTNPSPTGPLKGELDLLASNYKVRARLTALPGIPTNVYWLNEAQLLVRFDVGRQQPAADYVVPVNGGRPVAFGGGWLSLCPSARGVVLTRLDGTIGLLPPGATAVSDAQVIGKLDKLPLSCAAV